MAQRVDIPQNQLEDLVKLAYQALSDELSVPSKDRARVAQDILDRYGPSGGSSAPGLNHSPGSQTNIAVVGASPEALSELLKGVLKIAGASAPPPAPLPEPPKL